MVPRPGMMTILLILILGRLGQTAVRTAKPDSPYSATRPAPAEYVAELSHATFWPVLLMPGSTSPSLPGTACWPRATLRCAAGRRNLLTSGLERRDRGPPTTPPRARGRLAMVGSAAADRMARPASQTPLLLSLLRCAARKMSACGWPGRRRMRQQRSSCHGHRSRLARPMPAQLPAQLPAHVAWCVRTNVRALSPQVRACARGTEGRENSVTGRRQYRRRSGWQLYRSR